MKRPRGAYRLPFFFEHSVESLLAPAHIVVTTSRREKRLRHFITCHIGSLRDLSSHAFRPRTLPVHIHGEKVLVCVTEEVTRSEIQNLKWRHFPNSGGGETPTDLRSRKNQTMVPGTSPWVSVRNLRNPEIVSRSFGRDFLVDWRDDS